MGNPDGIARRCRLPNDEFGPAWTSIKLADGVHDRLLAQSLLSFIIRQKLLFEADAIPRSSGTAEIDVGTLLAENEVAAFGILFEDSFKVAEKLGDSGRGEIDRALFGLVRLLLIATST